MVKSSLLLVKKNGNIYALARRKKDFYSQTSDSTTKNLNPNTSLDFDKINGGKLLVEDTLLLLEISSI